MFIGGGHVIVGVVAVLVVLAVVAGVVLLIVGLTRPHHAAAPYSPAWQPPLPQQALAELDLRYARGEIDRQEYLQRRADLLGQPASPPTPATPGTPPR